MTPHIQKAIERAIEGGWKYPEWFEGIYLGTTTIIDTPTADLLLNKWTYADPLFWQALGKAEGWKEPAEIGGTTTEGWRFRWHAFINWLANGQDADLFFKNLLK